MERFRCSQGCDFDYCGECNSKAGASAVMPPKLMLVNMPDDGGFFEGPAGDVTAEVVKKLLADFDAGSIERKQLQK